MHGLAVAINYILAVASGETGSSGVLDSIISVIPKAFSVVGSILTSMVGIDLFAFLLAISLVGVGISLIGRMRRSTS